MTGQDDMFGGGLEGMRRDVREKSIRPNGTRCPVCDQHVDRGRRRLSQPMARILIAFYHADRQAPGAWHHLGKLIAKAFPDNTLGDGPKLRHWLLLEKHPTARHEVAKSAGLYRITEHGKRFVRRQVKCHSHGFSFNNKFALDPKSELVGIEWCLGKGFDYAELMRETGNYPP